MRLIVNPFQPAAAVAAAARRGRPAAILIEEEHLDGDAFEPGDHVLVVIANGALRRHLSSAACVDVWQIRCDHMVQRHFTTLTLHHGITAGDDADGAGVAHPS